jgi:cytochrome c553
LLALLALGGKGLAAGPVEPAVTPQQIEADWLRQDEVRWLPPSPRTRPDAQSTVTTRQDAAGAVDGVKDGTYGFHVGDQQDPWWQVDLGQSLALDRVVVFNRGDGNVEKRAAQLKVLLSDDGKSWKAVYQHDGSVFGGQTDGKPLVVPLRGAKARFVRLQLPGRQYFHLDEVEVYRVGSTENVALKRPADQSSVSQWSKAHIPDPAAKSVGAGEPSTPRKTEPAYPIAAAVERGLKLAADLRQLGADVSGETAILREIGAAAAALPKDAPADARRALYFKARWAVRRMALANPLLDFDDLVFVKRAPGTFTHMSDQNYGWFSRPGGGLCVLEGWKTDRPRLRMLATELPLGSFLSPDLSYDGKRIVFSHCKYYPGLREHPNKLDKANVPEDAFYHLYEINVDGTGLRRLTRGKYDDFDGRYLPNGEIVFLSTRRGQYLQCGKHTGQSCLDGALPDSYVRCGGGPERPVAVYTLHVMNAQGGDLRQISPFEMFEWTPSIDHDGRVLYARWDYVDRWNMPFMSLWSTLPDGSGAQAVFGNYTQNPHCVFEARAIPGSRKLIFTASGHHANTGGSLVLLDPNKGADGDGPMTRLTPEVCFPETEGWPMTYFVNPYPLSENHYLVAWSDQEMIGWPGPPEPVNATGIYLFDAFGNLNLVYRDPAISSMSPLPLKPRPRPPVVGSQQVEWDGEQEGRMLVLDVYEGLEPIPRGTIKSLRIVGVPVKTHPTMNYPAIGITHDDPGKVVLGTVPVDADGSVYFRVPSGVAFFVQALDAEGVAVQTMRSAAYVQPGQTTTCVGCHEPRNTSPPNRLVAALLRGPSKLRAGPEGSWPLDYAALVQPVLETHCVRCHKPGTDGAKWDLTAAKSYDTLVSYGKPSLREHVGAAYLAGRSTPGAGAAQTNPLVPLLKKGHYDVKLDRAAWERLYTWMDTYGQRQGSFGPAQEEHLRAMRRAMAQLLE